jgi:hypothetical protein
MAIMVDGGGGRVYQPQNHPQSYKVGTNESLQDVADRFGVTPQAIRDANPNIFNPQDPGERKARQMDAQEINGGGMLLPGDELTIPAAPMSVTEGDPITGEGSHPSTDVNIGVDLPNGGITWEPGSGKVQLTAKQQAETANANQGTKLTVSQESAVAYGQKNNNGNTEFTVEAQTKVATSGSIDAGGRKGGAEVQAGAGAGFKSSYQVMLPGENRPAEAAARVNPFDPTTIPVGGRVTMNSEAFSETSLAGSFRYIGTETKVQQGQGTTYVVERVDQNTVRVMMGPTEAVQAFNGVGLRAGPDLSVMLGRQDSLAGSTLKTADFDLSTPEGQAAYSHFTATGQVAHETKGVDNVATVERVDYSSQTQLRAKLGPLGVELGGAQNKGSVVKTSYPDGSFALTTELQYSGNVPLRVTQRFDAGGTEILSERTYQYEVKVTESNAELLNTVQAGRVTDSGPARPGQTVVLTFNEEQMQSLIGQTETAAETLHGADDLRLLVEGPGGRAEPMDFAISMARNLGGDSQGLSERLLKISDAGDGDIQTRGGFSRIDMDVETKSR